ncbi:hypothetical protein K456DRAFT_42951 [Colletotrichum gloeosporioides 23]|nr:hypothetical protein K456DRAFT_42951 [Colletotrichum gloeosporioides 23]
MSSSAHDYYDYHEKSSLSSPSWWDTVLNSNEAGQGDRREQGASCSPSSYASGGNGLGDYFTQTEIIHCHPQEPTLDLNIKQATKAQLEWFLTTHWGQNDWLPIRWQDSSSTCRTVLAQLALSTKLWLRHQPLIPLPWLWYEHSDQNFCGAFVRAIHQRKPGTVPLLTADNAKRAVQLLRSQFWHKTKINPSEKRHLEDQEGSGRTYTMASTATDGCTYD